MKLLYRHKMYMAYLSVFMAGQIIPACKNALEFLFLVPSMALFGFLIGVVLVALDLSVSRLLEIYQKAKP